MRLLFSEPVDSMTPLTFELALDQAEHCSWRSPAGNLCIGLSYMGEDGRSNFTILVYREVCLFP